jgi:hypothetical protein
MKRQNKVGTLLILLVALALGGAAGERTAAAAAPEPRVLEVTGSGVEVVDLTRTEPAVMAEHAMHQPSVAAFRQLSKNSFRTSVDQEIRLTARVASNRLASRLEWRVLAGQRLLGVLRGGEVRFAFSKPGRYTVEVGPRVLTFQIYRTVLTSHVTGRDTVPAGVPVTFTAVTQPPGFEQDITWVASGGEGGAEPLLGHGASFTVTFGDEAANELGVKADNAAFTQSTVLPPPPSGPTLALFQVDATLDGSTIVNSDWGSADLTFVGSSSVQYFNLSLNGFWAVQNMPVLSNEGSGVIQTQTFNFALGVPSGTAVSSMSYGLTLSTTLLSSPPPATGTASVSDRTVVIATGEAGESLFQTPARPAIGSAVAPSGANPLKVLQDQVVARKPAPAFNYGVPNQEVGVNECVPGAISNSLKFLQMQGLKLPDAMISIDAMKMATGWTPDGAPTAPTPWWDLKNMYMQKNGLPVTTTTSMSFADALAALGKHCDVELRVPGHAAVVTGIVPLANGDYGIIVQHDTDQGAAGGTKSEVVIYKSSDGTPVGRLEYQRQGVRPLRDRVSVGVVTGPDVTGASAGWRPDGPHSLLPFSVFLQALIQGVALVVNATAEALAGRGAIIIGASVRAL